MNEPAVSDQPASDHRASDHPAPGQPASDRPRSDRVAAAVAGPAAGSSGPPARPERKISGALLRFRILAFTTGVMLIAACISWIVKQVHPEGMKVPNTVLWIAHGYLYLAYVITCLDLLTRARWQLLKVVPIILAGTIPTMSFVAEHYVTKRIRTQFPAQF